MMKLIIYVNKVVSPAKVIVLSLSLHPFNSFPIDYEEPIVQTPFLMDPRYTSSMKKETQPTTGRYDQRRNQLNEDEEAK